MIMLPTMSIIGMSSATGRRGANGRDLERGQCWRAAIGPLTRFLVEHFWWGAGLPDQRADRAGDHSVAIRLLPESWRAEPPPWDGLR